MKIKMIEIIDWVPRAGGESNNRRIDVNSNLFNRINADIAP